MNVFLTGASGFVGSNFCRYFGDLKNIRVYRRGDPISIEEDVVVHLAGIAHDFSRIYRLEHYLEVNTDLTKRVFDAFLKSQAKVFIFLSSVKAVQDSVDGVLDETVAPEPQSWYGLSKLRAEEYINTQLERSDKRIYILRPCMIHGSGNKGNLNSLYKFISLGLPWMFGAFENQRSFCSVNNLMFIMRELIQTQSVPSGIYTIADDDPLSTNQVIQIIYRSLDKSGKIIKVPKWIIFFLARIGDLFKLPFNTHKVKKITESYVVSNKKIVKAIGKNLPIASEEGLLLTLKSFSIEKV